MTGLRFGRPTPQPTAARVNLLPREIEQAKRSSRTRSVIVMLAILSVFLVVAATGVTFVVAAAAQAQLLAARNETILIVQQQNEYVEARSLAQRVETVKAAQVTGTLTEIEMETLVRAVDATLPSGLFVSSFAIDSGTPIEDFPPPATPLERPRVATLILTATIPSIDAIQQWVVGLKKLDGFADVFVSNLSRSEETGNYEAIVTVNLNSDLYQGRFATADGAVPSDGQSEGTIEPTPSATAEAEATE